MNKPEINFTNMTDTVLFGCDAENGKWESKKPIETAINNIKAFRSEIAGLASDQVSLKTKGATQTLKDSEANMVFLAMDIVKRLRPFAIATNNNELLASIDFSKSDIDHGKQMDTLNKCKLILEKGRKYQPEMTGYGLTVEKLDTLESAINGLAMLSGNRDSIIGARKTATDGIPVLIKKIRVQLEMLDDLVPTLIDDDKFVQTFKNNRRIIDR